MAYSFVVRIAKTDQLAGKSDEGKMADTAGARVVCLRFQNAAKISVVAS